MGHVAINRRQFLQMGAGAAWAAQGLGHAWARNAHGPADLEPWANEDPHLALAWQHGFVDHDLASGWQLSRVCGLVPWVKLDALRSMLGGQGEIHTLIPQGEDAWVTLTLQPPALIRLRQGGAGLFKDHIWGAPWSRPAFVAAATGQQSPALVRPSSDAAVGAMSSLSGAARHRVLVIDHGFPIAHLRQQGVPHLHRFSPLARHPDTNSLRANGHGSQVTGLLLQGLDGRGPPVTAPLVLYELPDDILTSMPHALVWSEIIDAVTWVVTQGPRDCEWMVLLSLVSTDADRHPDSFISRSARALTAYARSLGVQLTWVMAAGNSHVDRQNLALSAQALRPVELQWHLPAQNVRPSFLECWHDHAMGSPRIEVQSPAGEWTDALAPLTLATRVHRHSARTQTVLRLPPTAAWAATQPLAASGMWRLRLVFEQGGPLDCHLSMMTSASQGLLRQAYIDVSTDNAASRIEPSSLSGLIPSIPQVVVAQTLHPNALAPQIEHPTHDQLSAYCGRWPQIEGLSPVRSIGFNIDASPVRHGALTWSRHGHRTHRVSGTSMAVPLAARRLMGLD